MKIFKHILALLFVLTQLNSLTFAQEEGMDKMWGKQKPEISDGSERGKFFSDGNYAMFIHWGIYSNLANEWKGKTYYGIGEWIKHKNLADIPVDEYKEVARTFNPTKFDADAIVSLAKNAGMKYIIITSKHHDGFAMFHSRASDFNIIDATPFGRDPMKELSEACKKQGLGFGFYYSQNQDWTAPGGAGGPNVDESGRKVTFEEYFEQKCLPQVREITTQYGDIVLVWFDTPGRIPKKNVEQLVAEVRKNQPNALVSGRVGHGMGDYQTFGDMEIPFSNIEGMWETVDVTNDSWGYAWYDNNWKSPKLILENLISTVARGGTYMLNIGPKGDGSIPEEASYVLLTAGEWLKKYPQVVYAADPSPWKHKLSWGDVTRQGDVIYLSVYSWPDNGKLYLPGLKTEIMQANLLGKNKIKLNYTNEKDWVIFDIPYKKPDDLISVIELELSALPVVDPILALDPSTSLVLSTHFAKATNCNKSKHRWMEKFGEWKHIMQVDKWTKDGKVSWEIDVFEPGYYMIRLKYAGTERTVWRVTLDDDMFIQNQQNASHVYHTYDVGWLNIDTAGKHKLAVSMIDGDFEKTSLESMQIFKVQ
jgi:alpha-L-fucosidase